MNVSEALRRIYFKIGTLDDITGRAINRIIETRYVIDELNTQLMHYANRTKGICDTYSTQLDLNQPVIQAPALALRSGSYLFAQLISQNRIYPLDMRGKNDALNNFVYGNFSGITSWLMPWAMGRKQYLTAYPTNNLSAKTTKLAAVSAPSDTTIEVESTDGFIETFGRIQIEKEKILYQYKDKTHFYGCIRAIEQSEIWTHDPGTQISQCNLVIYYARLPEKIEVTDDNFVSHETLAKEIEVCDEHLEGILKLVAYNLILKIDNTRAAQYKVDADALMQQYETDIAKGYSKIRNGANVISPYFAQSGQPMYTNLMQ